MKGYHSAILVGSDTTGWTYFSFSREDDGTGKNKSNLHELQSGQSFPKGATLAEVLSFGEGKPIEYDLRRYEMYIMWKTTPDQDDKVAENAIKWRKTYFEIATSNCTDFTVSVLQQSGIPIRLGTVGIGTASPYHTFWITVKGKPKYTYRSLLTIGPHGPGPQRPDMELTYWRDYTAAGSTEPLRSQKK